MENRSLMLTIQSLKDLTGQDFLSPLLMYSPASAFIFYLSLTVCPVALLLNLVVLVSSLVITARSGKPTFIFIAYNAVVDIWVILSTFVVVNGWFNPELAFDEPKLLTRDIQNVRCKMEKCKS